MTPVFHDLQDVTARRTIDSLGETHRSPAEAQLLEG